MLSLNLGPLVLSAAHAVLLLAAVSAWLVAAVLDRRARTSVGGALADVLLAAMLSARAGFVLMYFQHYRDAPWSVLDIRDGGFSAAAALLGGAVCAVYQLWRHPARRRALSGGLLAGALVWVAASLALERTQGPGSALLEASVMQMDGQLKSLNELAEGRPLVLNLWASWCPPCVREMPVLDEAQRRYPEVAFVFANQAEDLATVSAFVASKPWALNHMVLDQDAHLAALVGSRGLPTTLFIDADGKLVDSHFGPLSAATLASRMRPFGAPSPQ